MLPNRPAPPRITIEGLPDSGHLQSGFLDSVSLLQNTEFIKSIKMMNFDDFMIRFVLKSRREKLLST